jgi:hypothetical protein
MAKFQRYNFDTMTPQESRNVIGKRLLACGVKYVNVRHDPSLPDRTTDVLVQGIMADMNLSTDEFKPYWENFCAASNAFHDGTIQKAIAQAVTMTDAIQYEISPFSNDKVAIKPIGYIK